MPRRFFGLVISFALAVIFTLVVPIFFSKVEIAFLAIPLVMSFYFIPLKHAATAALFCGLFLDAVNLLPRLGFLGSTYLATTLLLYSAKRYFFKEAFTTLFIMTYLFSFIASCLQVVVSFLLDLPFTLTLTWLFCDCLIMPLFDAAFAMFVFSLPHFLYCYYYKKKYVRSHHYAS